MKHLSKVIVYTDGGSRGNPGPAAIGAVIEYGVAEEKKYAEYIGQATNNEAEYQAVIFALKKLRQLLGRKKAGEVNVEVHLDSELVGRQLEGQYKIMEKNLHPLFIEIWNLKQDFGKVSFKNIPRAENKMADKLVNQALDEHEGKGMTQILNFH